MRIKFFAAAGVLALGLAGGCGRRAAAVTTRELSMRRDRWLESRVRTAGTLEVFSAGKPDEYYTLDDDGYRVGVVGVSTESLHGLLGRRAAAEGTFGYRDGFGIYIRAERLEPAGGAEKP